MCLIIARTAGTSAIPLKYIENAADNNPDGFGIVGKDKSGDIHTAKDLDMLNVVEIIRDYERVDMDFAAHFRYKTHGKIDEENTHPFQYGERKNYLVHNGVISIATPDKDKSDTWHFVKEMTKAGVAPKAENLTRFLNKRNKMLGGSKFAFLGEDTPLLIYNDDAGIYEGGIWYSNAYSLEPPAYTKWVDSDGYVDWRDYGSTTTSGQYGLGNSETLQQYEDAMYDGTLTMADLRALDDDDLTWFLETYPEELTGLIKYGTTYSVGLRNR